MLGEERVVPLVVAVEEREQASSRGAEAGIARRTRPGVRLLQHPHARIASAKPRATSTVRSDEPSSTISSSRSANDCRSTDRPPAPR